MAKRNHYDKVVSSTHCFLLVTYDCLTCSGVCVSGTLQEFNSSMCEVLKADTGKDQTDLVRILRPKYNVHGEKAGESGMLKKW